MRGRAAVFIFVSASLSLSSVCDPTCRFNDSPCRTLEAEILDFRRWLHANPELSGKERETQQRIKDVLAAHGILPVSDIGLFGTLFTFQFGEGPHLLVRVDIDALAIGELNEFKHRSNTDGVSHKCGHDGHTAIGVGLAIKLRRSPLSNGTVSILFQGSEETGEGARAILEDERFNPQTFDYAVALHNIPGEPLHQVIWKYGSFTPAVQSLIIRLIGKTSHAAQPLKGKNPTYAIAEIVGQALRLEQTDESSPHYRLFTPVYTSIGTQDYGISAGYGEIHFTIRSWEQRRMEDATEELLSEVRRVADAHGLELTTKTVAVFASNHNHREVVDSVRSAAAQLELSTQQRSEPFPWGEDFGLFTQRIPGGMFGLGAGEGTPPLHSPDYDFPDALALTGVQLFYQTAEALCLQP